MLGIELVAPVFPNRAIREQPRQRGVKAVVMVRPSDLLADTTGEAFLRLPGGALDIRR
jgi:hypothetical protein